MKKLLAVGILSATLISPAFAVAPEEYWVVQDATKHCSVSTEKPMSPSTAVGNKSFKSRAEAEQFSKSAKSCAG